MQGLNPTGLKPVLLETKHRWTIVALAQRGGARNLVALVHCGEPKVAAERAVAFAATPRWADSEA